MQFITFGNLNREAEGNKTFYTLYALNRADANALSRKFLSATFIQDPQLLFFRDPENSIISARAYPFRPAVESPATTVFLGSYDTEIPANYVSGTIQHANLFSNVKVFPYSDTSYLDYAPYTSIDAYFPYVGFVSLDPAIVTNKNLSLDYFIDVVSGSFVAELAEGVTGYNRKVLYSVTGQMGVDIPISSSNKSENATSLLTGGISAAASLAAGIATGGVGLAAGIAGGVAQASKALRSTQEHINSGAVGGSYLSFVQAQFFYARVKRARAFGRTTTYEGVNGIPYPVSVNLSTCVGGGFTKITDCHVMASGATSTEIDEIYSLLREGVIL